MSRSTRNSDARGAPAGRKAQNAIEFLAMLMMLLLIFIGLFSFVLTRYSVVRSDYENALLERQISDLRNEIRLALASSDGYSKMFIVERRGSTAFNISIRNSAEIFINNSQGYQQILFLNPDEYVAGSLCFGQNNIVKSADYGISICCGSCNNTIVGINYSLPIECKTNVSAYWGNCNNLTVGSNLTQIRVNCSLWMTGANLTIYNQTSSQLLANTTSYNTLMRNTSISWVSLDLPVSRRLQAAVYNVTAVCFNATHSYMQRANFTIS